MATLYLLVGLPCSGKTTRALDMERELPALRLTTDEWHLGLFGQDAEAPSHDSRHRSLEALLWQVGSKALEMGNDVILDFGFWTREEREDYRLRARQLGASSEIVFLDASPAELLRRLKRRNEKPGQHSFIIPENMLSEWISLLEKPLPDELYRRE